MSSSDGVLRLKNWQSAEKALVVPSINWKGNIRFVEVRVRVGFVDESTLVLVNLDAAGEVETLSLRNATFSCTGGLEGDLEMTFADGKKLYLREEY